MNSINSVVLIFLAFLLSQGKVLAQPKWHTTTSPPFRIYYTDRDNFYVQELRSLFQLSYGELSAKLNLRLTQNIDVFLCASERDFARMTGNFVPHWGEGIAIPTRNTIVLKSPNLTNNYDRQKQLVLHELIHVLIGHWSRVPLPRWFNEGVAMYFAHDREFAKGEALSKAMLSDSVIPLDEIDDVLRFQKAKARLAYEESFLFIEFIAERFGDAELIQFIQALGESESFDATFKQVFGLDVFDLELDWLEFIKKKYRWRFFADFETFLWFFILAVFILVFVAIKLRNRKTIRRWEQEDRFASTS